MVRQVLTRAVFYEILGRLLFYVGIILACFLVSRFARGVVDQQVLQQSNYLLIASTPVFQLPPATPLPTFTPTPVPTATPLPLPATRLSIPAIKLNTTIEDISPVEKILANGAHTSIWEPVAFAVGHYDTSGNPGEGRNIVLSGHNNTEGEVFRYLDQLHPGDEVILFTANDEFHYQVQKKYLIPYLGAEEEADAQLQSFAAPQSTEIVTLISCWPYLTNFHRIIIIAIPSPGGDENGY